MNAMRIEWKEIPKEQTIFQIASRYPDVKPKSFEFFLKIMWISAQIDRTLETHFNQWDLSRGRFMLLMMLYKGYCGIDTGLPDSADGTPRTPGVMTPSELAANLDVTRGNMTGLIDGLEREGWIRREAHPDDRRGLLVILTDEGRTRLEAMLPVHYRRMGLLLSKLSTAEAETVLPVIRILVDGVERLREDVEKGRTNEANPKSPT
jgi:DNA-binding MarR family transcriptional regulator